MRWARGHFENEALRHLLTPSGVTVLIARQRSHCFRASINSILYEEDVSLAPTCESERSILCGSCVRIRQQSPLQEPRQQAAATLLLHSLHSHEGHIQEGSSAGGVTLEQGAAAVADVSINATPTTTAAAGGALDQGHQGSRGYSTTTRRVLNLNTPSRNGKAAAPMDTQEEVPEDCEHDELPRGREESLQARYQEQLQRTQGRSLGQAGGLGGALGPPTPQLQHSAVAPAAVSRNPYQHLLKQQQLRPQDPLSGQSKERSRAVTGEGARSNEGAMELSKQIIANLFHFRPKQVNACWVCGSGKCQGLWGCNGWKRLTGLSDKPLCSRDGCAHRVDASTCTSLTVPTNSSRCYNCLLPYGQHFGFALHLTQAILDVKYNSSELRRLAEQDEKQHCRAIRDRQRYLLLTFVHSYNLRRGFVKAHGPHLSRLPGFWSQESILNVKQVQEYFEWLWELSCISDIICNIDIIFVFMYKLI